MYIDHIWPFTTFISRNKHNKNIRLRLYWLRLRVAEAEVQTSHLGPLLRLMVSCFEITIIEEKIEATNYFFIRCRISNYI